MSNRILISQQRTRVKSVNVVGATSTGISGVTLLDDLKDVNPTNKANNNTLVYDAVSQKYVVRELPIINGGTF